MLTVHVEFTPRDQYIHVQAPKECCAKKHVTSFRYKIWFYFFIYGIKSVSTFFLFMFYYSFEDQFCWLRVIRYAYLPMCSVAQVPMFNVLYILYVCI